MTHTHPAPRMSAHTSIPRLVATVAAMSVVALITMSTAAGAHVGIMGATTTGADTDVRFKFDHGCDGSPTVAMDLRLPDGATVVNADLPSGWDITDPSTEARLAGDPIADDATINFMLTLTGYDTSVSHLVPVVQRCEQGELAWIDSDPTAAYPAPALPATTTEPSVPPAPQPAEDSTSVTGPTPEADLPEPVTAADDAEADRDAILVAEAEAAGAPWPIIIIAAVVAGALALGSTLVVRSRRKTSS